MPMRRAIDIYKSLTKPTLGILSFPVEYSLILIHQSSLSLSLIHIVPLLFYYLSIPMGLHEHAGAGDRL